MRAAAKRVFDRDRDCRAYAVDAVAMRAAHGGCIVVACMRCNAADLSVMCMQGWAFLVQRADWLACLIAPCCEQAFT